MQTAEEKLSQKTVSSSTPGPTNFLMNLPVHCLEILFIYPENFPVE